MMVPRCRRRRTAGAAALATALLAATLHTGAAPATAETTYSSPAEVPDPFQDYSAQDFSDALWTLETGIRVRTHDREERGDCEVQTYTATHPLNEDNTRTYAQVISEDDGYCRGSDGDELREELDDHAEEDEDFFHGRPYELEREGEDSRPFEALRQRYYGDWADITGNGVTSRVEIHARDTGSDTWQVSGEYYDHYTGQQVDIGDTETHGEHVVPVSFTWPELQHASQERREAYYNDPMNLTSTIGSVNREKSGHTPSRWLPENEGAWCSYATTWVHTADTYGLSLYRSDITVLREILWDCVEDELSGAESSDDVTTMPGGRSEDLDWSVRAPELTDTDTDDDADAESGPRGHYTALDYQDAVWNLENHVRIRSVERESHGECDIQTHTTSHPRSGEELTYSRVISSENTYCKGDEADELREELEEEAEVDGVFHTSPLAGQREEAFGDWNEDEDGLTTDQQVMDRDTEELTWENLPAGLSAVELYDPYSGDQEITYEPEDFTVDHILPVAHAWVELENRSSEEREEFFNDPANLLATTAETARERDAEAPRNWMPEHQGFHCRYAVAWVHTAAGYDISLFSSDVTQLRSTLYSCLNEDLSDGEAEGPRRADLDWASLTPVHTTDS